jgi:hypothetical protein
MGETRGDLARHMKPHEDRFSGVQFRSIRSFTARVMPSQSALISLTIAMTYLYLYNFN